MVQVPLSPAVATAAALSLGVAAGTTAPVPPALASWLALAGIAVVALVARSRPTGTQRQRAPRRAAVALLVGLARAAGAADPAEASPAPDATPGRLVTADLTVAESPLVTDRLDPHLPPTDGEARSRFATVEGPPVLVEGDVGDLCPGDRVRVRGRLLPARAPQNPGAFVRRQRSPLLWVPRVELVTRVGAGTDAGLSMLVGRMRSSIRETIAALYSPDSRGIVLALLTGDRRLVDVSFTDGLERTGTFHFLAVSGLHAGIVLALLLRLPLPRRGATVVRVVVLAFFALITGAAPPVVRAVLMLSLALVASAVARTARSLDTLAWAAAVVLIAQPALIADVGFQLSVVAVFAIVTWTDRMDPARPGIAAVPVGAPAPGAGAWSTLASVCRKSLAVSLAASAGTAPLVLYFFHRVHPLSPLWNLVVYPPVALTLTCGGASVLLGSIHESLGAPLAAFVELQIALLRWLLGAFGAVPGSCVHLPRPPAALVLASVALVFASPFLRSLRPVARRRLVPIALAALGVAIAGSTIALRSARVPAVAPRVWCFDVGAGSSQLIILPGGATVLVDAGSSDLGPRVGTRLGRALLSLGVRRVAGLVLTHKDADHVNGIAHLAARVSIGRVWTSPLFERFEEGRAVVEMLRERGMAPSALARGDRIVAPGGGGPSWSIRVLHPAADERLPLVTNANEGSLVLALDRDGRPPRALLLADIEEAGTARLLGFDEDLRADLLIFPHHGARNELTGELLARCRPRRVVISAGDRGHAGETAEALERRGIAVHWTRRDGAGRFDLAPDWRAAR